jgi:hypothetical protein
MFSNLWDTWQGPDAIILLCRFTDSGEELERLKPYFKDVDNWTEEEKEKLVKLLKYQAMFIDLLEPFMTWQPDSCC